MSDSAQVDLLVIGGGINGAGIARDAAGRGLSVVLCEQDDLASSTSSASSKLIHGGLRYLEYYEFRLVRESLRERQTLLNAAPHIIWPLSFVLPHNRELRPAWLIRLGLLLYDGLAGPKDLPRSRAVDFRRHISGEPLHPELRKGFIYYDGWVEDSRLVVLNAMDAAEHGAQILTRTRCVKARRANGRWEATLAPTDGGGAERRVRARAVVNAGGPWVAQALDGVFDVDEHSEVRLVKGSHIVVPRLYQGEHAYILQNVDQRVVFVIPYEGAYSLIGTTDVEFESEPSQVSISPGEIEYLCDAVNRYFERPVKPEHVVWSYSGVRPLFDDDAKSASAVTRDYVLETNTDNGGAPLLSVFGGKITTYRRLAEEVLQDLKPLMDFDAPAWTEDEPLPGGDIENADFDAFVDRISSDKPWLPPELARRYARAYGTRIDDLLGNAQGINGLGEHFGDGIYEAEIEYLIEREWARTAEDILWRRSKLGLHVSKETVERLAARMVSCLASTNP